MKLFLHAHATHPDWRMALSLATAQFAAQRRSADHVRTPSLGFAYLTDHYAPHAEQILTALQHQFPGVQWVGTVGVGVAANGVEYFDEPALALMLGDLSVTDFRLFSGTHPLGSNFDAHTALVHADPAMPDLAELVGELSTRTATGYLFGGLSSARNQTLHFADEVLQGGLSGVAFGPRVHLISRVTQGCQPIGPTREITAVEQNVVLQLDRQPALDCLLRDLDLEHAAPGEALPRLRAVLVGLTDAGSQLVAHPGQFGSDTVVRHLIGLDPHRRGVAIAELPEAGMQLAFCGRHVEAARRDLVRICAEIREELEPRDVPMEIATALAANETEAVPQTARGIAGALYVSCAGRGGPHFGSPSAELALVRRALGDVPLAGFFAGGEIARHHLYGYTGVLTVFAAS